MEFDYYSWIILPLIIFFSRLCDVSLGTLRHIFIAKGLRKIVPFVGFFEVLIWIIVVAQVMKNLNNVACYLAWAGGFASGTYVGLILEERLALGKQVIRIITNQNCDELIAILRKDNHGITIIDANGAVGPVKILYTVIDRVDARVVRSQVEKYLPNAFYTIEEIKDTNMGVFTPHYSSALSIVKRMFYSPEKPKV